MLPRQVFLTTAVHHMLNRAKLLQKHPLPERNIVHFRTSSNVKQPTVPNLVEDIANLIGSQLKEHMGHSHTLSNNKRPEQSKKSPIGQKSFR
jgi:hypothetical protein